MGAMLGDARAVDVEYDSYFLLLTREFGKHRVSARYDNFDMSQNDDTDEDQNPEYGLAWTLGYRFSFSNKFSLAAEWLSIKTHRCAYEYYDLDETVTETQFQLTLQARF